MHFFHNLRFIGMPRTKKEGKKVRKCCLQAVVLPDCVLVTNFRAKWRSTIYLITVKWSSTAPSELS